MPQHPDPVYLAKNGEGGPVVTDIDSFIRRKKLALREQLLGVEEDRFYGRTGCTLEELGHYLDDVLGKDLACVTP